MPRLFILGTLLILGLFIAAAPSMELFAAAPARAGAKDDAKKKEDDKKKDEKKKNVPSSRWREAVDPLHAAAFDNQLAEAKKLIKSGADVNAAATYRQFTGFTPLHMAAFEGHEKMIDLLVSAKAELEHKEKASGRTPLHLACAYNRIAAAQALIKAGADFKVKDKKGNTALMLASDKAIVAELKKAGATE